MKTLLLVLLSISLLACNQQTQQQLPESKVIALVGEEVITTDLLKAFLQANGVVTADETTVNKALDSLVDEMAMANIASKKKLKMTAEQLNTFKYLQIKAMANNAKLDYLLDNPITDAAIMQEYNKVNKQAGGLQFHVHHLLYADEV
ncbi:hypothetical protein MNBD_GAMMA01-1004, partial [hydrothermal vent metagenome]